MKIVLKTYSFLLFIQTTVQIAKELNDKIGLANAYFSLGRFYIAINSGYAKATPFLL